MVKAFSKHSESKRMTCHKKYKIRRKVREHNKKLAKNLKNSVGKKRKIDGNIPNMAPFKEELLVEAMQQTEARAEEKKQRKKKKEPLIVTKPSKPVEAPIVSAKPVSYHVTVSQCEVVLWVVDVRSPPECFSEEILNEIKAQNKTVVFVLNKIDLIPSFIVNQWYSFFQSKGPTYLMKSTEVILTDCEQIIPALKTTIARFGGTKTLMAYLKSISSEIKKVGIIGGPQVGKSSVVSSILKCCGRTKAKKTKETKLNESVRLVTSTGLIEPQHIGLLTILKNMHQYMNYPAEIIRALSTCIDKQEAMFHFTLPEFDHPAGFLDALAVRYNLFYQKEPDHDAVGRLILKQVRDRKLKFYVKPDPAETTVDVPREILDDVNKFLFAGDALKLNTSQLNLEIKKKEKKKKGSEMDIDEEDEENEDGDEEYESIDEDEDEDEEMC